MDKHVLRSFLRYLKFERKISQKTLENYFSALSTLYGYLAYEEVVPANSVLPSKRRYKNDEEQYVRRLLTVEELTRIGTRFWIRGIGQ